MNFTRAFTFAFEDRDWVAKLLMTLAVTLGALLLTIPLVGFALWAILLSYLADIARNVRLGSPQPLPSWSDFGGRLARGANILVAIIVYNLPNALLGCCAWILSTGMGGSFTGTTVTLGVACCVFPLLLIYNVISLPLLALGIARYNETPRTGVLFEFPALFALLRAHMDATLQYILALLLANLVLLLLALIPCAGWLAAPALLVPVHGYLIGQYSLRVMGRPPARGQQRSPFRR